VSVADEAVVFQFHAMAVDSNAAGRELKGSMPGR
jgi:hypothetical protein